MGIGLYFSSGKAENSPRNEVKNEIHDFPIYPGSRYLNSELMTCPSPYPAIPECGATSRIWETTQQINRVADWYKENTNNSEWKLTGGAGSAGSFVTETYEKNGKKVTLQLSTYGEEQASFQTKIRVIPLIK